MVDELEFYDYIDFIDKCGSSFNKSNQLLHFDEFLKMYGRCENIDKVVIDKDEISESIIKEEKEQLLFIKQNGLFFSLNEDSKTANIVKNFFIKGDVFIEKTIKHNGQEFIITRLKKGAFKEAHMKSIQFPPDSELKIIENDAFKSSKLSSFVKIPSNVKYIGKLAFDRTDIDSVILSN